jgi:superfamily II DNA or RNA helicase
MTAITTVPTSVALTAGAAVTIDVAAPLRLRQAIMQALTIENPAYREAEKHGYDTRELEPWLCYYSHTSDGALVVPRGAGRLICALCDAHEIPYRIVDATHEAAPVYFEERVTLSLAQERAVGEVLQRRIGVLEAPAGAGKTVMAMALIARRRQPTLIIVHTKELAAQAIARAVVVLGLDEEQIGLVGDGHCTVGQKLTVGLVQTLARGIPPALRDVGNVVVDECHHTPAEHMATVIGQFPARYVLGLSATPYRRDKLDRVINFYLGSIVARIHKADLADRLVTPRVIKSDTALRLAGDSFTELVSQLVADDGRNRLIVADVAAAAQAGRRCLVLSDRVGHVERLAWLLTAAGVTAAPLHGRLPRWERAGVVEDLAAGDLQAVVATGSLVGEGFDCPSLDALFIATPVSYGGRVVQYLGRVSRTAPGKVDAVVYDYFDHHPMLYASWRNRRIVYARQGCDVLTPQRATMVRRRAS